MSGTLPAGDAGTAKTLAIMQRLARDGAKEPIVRYTALQAIQGAGVPPHDPTSQIGALFRYVRDGIMFIGDPAGVELLQSPRETIKAQAGDCDDRAVLLAALARSIGIPAELSFKVIAANPRRPSSFSHVYVVARVGGRAIALDPTYPNNVPGFEYPLATRASEVPA